MNAYIKTLQNSNKSEIIYPVTKAGAVYMDDNSATVQDVLQDVASKEYVDKAINDIPTPDVSGQIAVHNTDSNSHEDIRQAIETAKADVKNDLLNGAGEAYDTLKELGELIDENTDAIGALEIIAINKADKNDIKQSDWNINDPESPAYIKNRTHWEEVSETVLVEETCVLSEGEGVLTQAINGTMTVGQTYTVNYGGAEYELIAEETDVEGVPFITFGNTTFVGGASGENYSFLIAITPDELVPTVGAYGAIIDMNMPESVAVSINGLSSNIHIIPDKFLPKSKNSNIVNGSSVGSVRTRGANANEAMGEFAFAEGYDTIASGESSHAEGNYTTASGFESHAEGYYTLASGDCSHAEGQNTIASGGNSHAEGVQTTASGFRSHAEGDSTTASGSSSHAEGNFTIAYGEASHAEGDGKKGNPITVTSSDFSKITEDITYKSSTAYGAASHAEGYHTLAYGNYSHAEGEKTKAYDSSSHAEGYNTTASGTSSHAEGSSTIASGNYSHAEGGWTEASGNYSHAEGNYTIARSTDIGAHVEGFGTWTDCSYQHVQGKYNLYVGSAESSNYAHIVGNGTDDHERSNAHTLDWDGNAWFAGDVYVGSTSGVNKDDGSKKLATVADIEAAIGIAIGGSY